MSSNVKLMFPQQNAARQHPTPIGRPVLINGDGAYTSPPGLVQDSQFPMAHALTPGRNGTVWRCPAAPASNFSDGSSVVLEIDTVSNVSPLAWGVLGYRNGHSQPNEVTLEVRSNATYASGVSGWVAVGSLALNPDGVGTLNDYGQLMTPVVARYWRWRFKFATSSALGFQVSGLFLQTAITDLGFLYSGADETRIIPRTMVESYARNPTYTKVGGEFRRWSLRYDNNDAALRTTFDDLFSYQASQEPFIFLTPDGLFFECVWDDEAFTRSHIWAPPDRYQFTVGLRSLG